MTEKKQNDKTDEKELLRGLLCQIEDYICMGNTLKAKVEQVLTVGAGRSMVREPAGNYKVKPSSKVCLMPDFYIDENGKITDIDFTLVKESQRSN